MNVWSSVAVSDRRADDVAVYVRSGTAIGRWGWLGASARWNQSFDVPDVVEARSLELSLIGTWFHPPYRPSAVLTYDAIQRRRVLAVISIPYTIRLGSIPPTTFIPEFGFRLLDRGSSVAVDYLSFSGLFEHRWRWLTAVPILTVVPRQGGLEEWIVWGGLHLGATRQ